MNIQEIYQQLVSIPKLSLLPDGRTFVERVPGWKAYHFWRPFAEDVLLSTSVQHLSEPEAILLGGKILDRLGTEWDGIAARQVTLLQPWEGPSFTDRLLVLGRNVAKDMPPKAPALKSISVTAFPIHRMEFAGDQTAAEVEGRLRDMPWNDMTRTPSPIVFVRFRWGDVTSPKHFVVESAELVLGDLKHVVIEGGRLEYENFERERCLLTAERRSERLEMHVAGLVRTVTHEQAIGYFHTLTQKGIDALKKELG